MVVYHMQAVDLAFKVLCEQIGVDFIAESQAADLKSVSSLSCFSQSVDFFYSILV